MKEINHLAINIFCDISSFFSLSTKIAWSFWQIAYAGFGNWWSLSNRDWCWLQRSLLQSNYSEDLGHPLRLHRHPNTSDTFTVWFVGVMFFSCREEQCARYHHSHSPPLVQAYKSLRAYYLPRCALVNEFDVFIWFTTVFILLSVYYKKSCVASFTGPGAMSHYLLIQSMVLAVNSTWIIYNGTASFRKPLSNK